MVGALAGNRARPEVVERGFGCSHGPVGDGLGPSAEPTDVMQARWLRLLDATKRASSRMRAARPFRCGAAVSIQAWRPLDINRSGIERRPREPASGENGF